MDDEDIYAAMEMEQMDGDMPEGPQNYFAPMANVSSSQNLPSQQQTAHLYYEGQNRQQNTVGENSNLVAQFGGMQNDEVNFEDNELLAELRQQEFQEHQMRAAAAAAAGENGSVPVNLSPINMMQPGAADAGHGGPDDE